jgi:serine/threonine-protein kinase
MGSDADTSNTFPPDSPWRSGCGRRQIGQPDDSHRRPALPDLAELQTDLAGRYVIERELGRGGMATVYLAQDLRHERPVALKVLRPDLSSSLGGERFLREIKVAARLQHPHILTVLDSGQTGSRGADAGRLWFTMPFVEGETLRERLGREGRLPIETALRIAREVAQALQYAHARGVVHRDIKPENLLLTSDGNTLVADFGIARELEAPGGRERLTETGLSIGTPSYMSPEQSAGDRQVDARSDVYSLGCVLYEMLAGEPPYTGPSAQAVIVKRFTEPVPSVRERRPEVTAAIGRVVERALAREPDERFPTVEAFAAALRADAGPSGAPTVAAPAAASDAAPPRRSVAVLPFLSLSPNPDDELFADGITEDVIAQLSKIRTMTVISRGSAMQFRQRDRDLRTIGATLRVGALLHGSVRRAGERVRIVAQLVDAANEQQLWADTYDRQLTDIFQIQSDVALQIASALKAELSPAERTRIRREPTANMHAYQFYLLGRNSTNRYSDEGLERGIRYFESALAADPGFALAHVGIARAYADLMSGMGSAIPPGEAMRRAKEALSKALTLDEGLGEAHAVLGLIKFAFEFDWVGGERELQLALELNPGSADVYDYYGWLCWALERNDEAIAYVTRAAELDPLAHRSDVAAALMRAGRYEEARAIAARLVELEPDYSRGHSTLGFAEIKLGRHAEGIAALEEAVRRAPGDAMYVGQLGEAYGLVGRTDEARGVLRQLEALARERYVSPYVFAYVHTGLGEPDQAVAYLERAFEQHAGGVYGIKGSYLFAPLRGHPRFQALLARMNLA